LIFLALQPREVAVNYPSAEFVKISQFTLENGAGVREPLAETFTWAVEELGGLQKVRAPSQLGLWSARRLEID
jgi:hypothetical protein